MKNGQTKYEAGQPGSGFMVDVWGVLGSNLAGQALRLAMGPPTIPNSISPSVSPCAGKRIMSTNRISTTQQQRGRNDDEHK
jgi:hypothetical protein